MYGGIAYKRKGPECQNLGVLLVPLFLLSKPDFDTQMLDIERQLKVGRIGVGIRNLKTGQTWFYRRSELFPMQSVFKFPLGVAVLDAVDHGQLSLDKRVPVGLKQLSVPMSHINESYHSKTLWYTNAQLLEMAVGKSDNTAADLLLEELGGPIEATKRLHKLGIAHIRIDRPERQIQVDYCSIPRFTPLLTTESGFQQAMAKVSDPQKLAALAAFAADRRDTATPIGMIELLTKFDSGKLLSPASQKRLRSFMTVTTTGPHRLKAGLPKGTVLIHKTGTGREILGICGALNDVGIAKLPGGRKLAIVVFVAGSSGTTAYREKIIADIARIATRG